jgi:cupin 2 domain-containing protein
LALLGLSDSRKESRIPQHDKCKSGLDVSIVAVEHGNLFDAIPETLSGELFSHLVSGSGFRLEKIVSLGHSSPASGWYDQEENEWVLVIEGSARLAFDDGTIVEVQAGDYVNLPAHTRHRVAWTDPDRKTVWLALYYA